MPAEEIRLGSPAVSRARCDQDRRQGHPPRFLNESSLLRALCGQRVLRSPNARCTSIAGVPGFVNALTQHGWAVGMICQYLSRVGLVHEDRWPGLISLEAVLNAKS